MMTIANEIGPDVPVVLALDELLQRFDKVRYTAEERAAAADADTISYLDFLRFGDRRPSSQPEQKM